MFSASRTPNIVPITMPIIPAKKITNEAINSCWEKCDEKSAYMFNVHKNQQSRQTGRRNLMGPKALPMLWSTYMKLVTKYQISAINSCWAKCVFRNIFLSNYWWHKSDIWSQALYRYPISWEAFLDPSDSYFLLADFVDFYTHWTYMLIFRRIFLSNYWWQESDIWSQASYKYAILWEAF
jgi:hypothetical protein